MIASTFTIPALLPGLQKAACPTCGRSDAVVDSLQERLGRLQEDLAEVRSRLTISEAKLDESRRALDRLMGFRS
jgi:hypothetical protein